MVYTIPHDITVIQVYAPTSDHEDEEEEQFYQQLDSIIAKTPNKDTLVVRGDWNVKVGPDAYQHWAGIVRRSGIGERNDRGWRLLEFAKSHRFTLANTLRTNRLFKTVTWQAPNRQVHIQIGFIMAPKRFKSMTDKMVSKN